MIHRINLPPPPPPDWLLKRFSKNAERQIAVTVEFCTMAPKICGPSVWNLFHIVLLVHRNSKLLLDFWKICVPLTYNCRLQGMMILNRE